MQKRYKIGFGIGLLLVLCMAFVIALTPIFHTAETTSYLTEDQSPLFTYNLTNNVTNTESEVLVFTVVNVSSSFHGQQTVSYFSWISLNSSTGVLTFNSTTNNHTGIYNISVRVADSNPTPDEHTQVFYFNVNATNDAPTFLNLANQTLNKSFYNLILQASDEENDVPYVFNVSFVSCTHTALNPPMGPGNCTLFNLTSYNSTATNISFTPALNQKGEYIINFSVRDTNNTVTPYNASYSQLVNFTLTWNDDPYFTFVCSSPTTGTENSEKTCYINASDPDELNNLTFSANYSWFLFNTSGTNSVGIPTVGGNASAYVNFTPQDAQVGNWSVNISVQDTGAGQLINSTILQIYIANVNDSVAMIPRANVTAYTSNNYTIHINASDDDLLIPDSSVYNEDLTFSSNTSWVNVSAESEIAGTNITMATLTFNPNDGGEGNHSINISVNDSNGFSQSSFVFVIQIFDNAPPQWIAGTQTNYTLTEDVAFYLNLTQNVTDAQGDALTFSYTNDTAFPTFSLGASTGVISFTPVDGDVGQHILAIDVSDGVTASSLTFNFTVSNVNDNATYETPITVTNASVDAQSNVITSEDNYTILEVFVRDNDLRVPLNQKGFYNESLSLAVTLQGPNTTLFSFSRDSAFPTGSGANANLSLFVTNFTPGKNDVGLYNVTLNVTDVSNVSVILTFNLTVQEINHAPVITDITNQSSAINETFTLDVNATDVEEGSNESEGGFRYTLGFLGDGKADTFYFGNESVFNSTHGIFNVTFNDSQFGAYHLNVTVNDTNGSVDSTVFWLFVYDSPVIHAPNSSYVFTLVEGNMSNLTFMANDSIGESNLTYYFYINGVLRENISSYGNGSNATWAFTPNYTDETYGSYSNFSLTVVNPLFAILNASVNWSMNITHANAPVTFIEDIPEQEGTQGTNITLNLSSYFSDPDFTDTHYNQSITITYASNMSTNSSINVTVNTTSAQVIFYSSSAVSERFNITIADLNGSAVWLTNDTSNNFNVTFEATTGSDNPSGGGGGGGGGSSSAQSEGIRVDVPAPMRVSTGQTVIAGISIVNLGSTILSDVRITYVITKNGTAYSNWAVVLSDILIDTLEGEGIEAITLTATPLLVEKGMYEIAVTASNDDVTDTDILYINVEGESETELYLQFVQGLIEQNQDCLEVQELVDLAQSALNDGDYDGAETYLDTALEGCEALISLQAQTQFAPPLRSFFNLSITSQSVLILIILSVILFMVFILYDLYVRVRFRKMVRGYEEPGVSVYESDKDYS